MNSFRFEITHRSKRSLARTGRLYTAHGIIETPAFVSVGTNATLKSCLEHEDVPLMFANTYHLLVHPGAAVIAAAGGLHRFMRRDQPIITDSGGFQLFSLAYGSIAQEIKCAQTKSSGSLVVKINEDGALFRSYHNGDPIFLSPESSIAAQKSFGSDIMISFDELPPYHIDPEALKSSLDRTHRWELRSLAYHQKEPSDQALYAVIHGGTDPILRTQSCALLQKHPFDGFAIGGSLGKDKAQVASVVATLSDQLPKEAPVHLLGIGDLESIHNCIPYGIDSFDSAYPTRAARHGTLLTKDGSIKIGHNQWKNEHRPINGCGCKTCQNYSLAYIHHLFKAKELNGFTLASIHNIHFMAQEMRDWREKIQNDLV